VLTSIEPEETHARCVGPATASAPEWQTRRKEQLVVQELVRHANLEDSRRYVAFDISRLQPVVNGLPVTADLDEVTRRRLPRHGGA
jgi:hypothetical protein